ncbi:hypothetical protein E2C01_058287 [Portunus trituberculatus]|uniref:Uncharacterized protein n=1 Tax=Portunus trituberculatus TaxID=210409 RepID=A0A5B7H2S3_PORTR|nr:hypothetical protein [Portunus trituberculatus]
MIRRKDLLFVFTLSTLWNPTSPLLNLIFSSTRCRCLKQLTTTPFF